MPYSVNISHQYVIQPMLYQILWFSFLQTELCDLDPQGFWLIQTRYPPSLHSLSWPSCITTVGWICEPAFTSPCHVLHVYAIWILLHLLVKYSRSIEALVIVLMSRPETQYLTWFKKYLAFHNFIIRGSSLQLESTLPLSWVAYYAANVPTERQAEMNIF